MFLFSKNFYPFYIISGRKRKATDLRRGKSFDIHSRKRSL